ncbi:hypothetical protein ISS37_03645 [candidate division KSB1 bacterium]|nr:hypothetical protein [candidate division KSB1 bacterium]
MKNSQKQIVVFGLALLFLVTASCAPGNEMFDTKLAGFWAGLWHGLICVVTFIISLFTDSVRIYEASNTGGWYDFGFLLGAAILLGGSWGPYGKKKRAKSLKDKEWEEIGLKVEEKIRKGIQSWLEEPEQKEKEWKEIGEKIEEKIKRELRNWADK